MSDEEGTQRHRWGPPALPLFLRKHILTSNPQKTYPPLRISFRCGRACSIEQMFLVSQVSVFVAARPADQGGDVVGGVSVECAA
ncbi:hypothetical protein B0G82_4247 [Paraburkholderia sp. BL17N1]|nr:hypothetical protein B0G82_4247 [Paraburkholderia sp. BL17N1]